ncbi:MAG: type II CAAX prenyl endopeptidase Rce1 family protein [Anaerolineales bacterium]
MRPILYMSILGLLAMMVIFVPLSLAASEVELQDTQTNPVLDTDAESDDPDDDSISTANVIGAIVTALSAAAINIAFLFQPVREWVARFLPKPQAPAPARAQPTPMLMPTLNWDDDAPPPNPAPDGSAIGPEDHGANGGFRPDSMMHMWAGILAMTFLAFQLMSFFLADGLSGLAEGIAVDYSVLIANFIPLLLIPLMGVGLFIRRSPAQVLQRLGLTKLTWQGLLVSLGATVFLILFVFTVSILWQLVVSEETYQRQTEASEALAASVDEPGLAFTVAFTAGVGEEIAYRGALQPIFGFWFTTIFFVLSHTQYALTPATLIIFAVAAVFGLIRKYFNTTAAILTHFLYNFTLLMLSLAGQQLEPESWLVLLLTIV